MGRKERERDHVTMNDPAQAIATLPAPAARMLAVEILLAAPEALGDDVLESCLYLLRERMRAAAREPCGAS
jgi:hypothetical protein